MCIDYCSVVLMVGLIGGQPSVRNKGGGGVNGG